MTPHPRVDRARILATMLVRQRHQTQAESYHIRRKPEERLEASYESTSRLL